MSDVIAEALRAERERGYRRGFDDTTHRLFMQIAKLPPATPISDILALITALKIEDLPCKENKT